jgi:hypothetical protein
VKLIAASKVCCIRVIKSVREDGLWRRLGTVSPYYGLEAGAAWTAQLEAVAWWLFLITTLKSNIRSTLCFGC